MNIGSFVRTLKEDLIGAFETPVKIIQLRLDQKKDYYFRVCSQFEDEGINFGLDLDIQWRHVVISLSTFQDFILNTGIFEKFRTQYKKNIEVIRNTVDEVKKLGCQIEFIVNGKHFNSVDDIYSNEVWQSFSFKITSSYLLAYDGLDIHYDNFSDVIVLAWSLLDIFLSYGCIYKGDNVDFISDGEEIYYQGIKYERDPRNRLACIKAHGYVCAACGINLEKVYGVVGRHVIEIHHIDPVSTYNGARLIDPVRDLVPLCPNCHTIAHRKNPPYAVEEIRNMIAEKECNNGSGRV